MKIFYHTSEINQLKPTVITIGTFDGVHLGHQKIINRLLEIKKHENLETLLFTFDPHPRKVLENTSDKKNNVGIKLITTTEEKITLLKKFGIDNLLIYPFSKEFSVMQSQHYISDILVSALKTKKIVIGYDHRFGSNRDGNIDTLKQFAPIYNFEVEEIPVQEINQLNISSTLIRKSIENGEIETANEYLGYSFFITGKVIEGKKLGRTIGYPTANLHIENTDKIIPKIGVYAVRINIDNASYKGMLNIGVNPTTDKDDAIKIEVNIFDFNTDIYGKTISIEFVKRLRDELKFTNLEELTLALHQDKIDTLHVL